MKEAASRSVVAKFASIAGLQAGSIETEHMRRRRDEIAFL